MTMFSILTVFILVFLFAWLFYMAVILKTVTFMIRKLWKNITEAGEVPDSIHICS